MTPQRRQLTIVHMTDLHFGANHRFDPHHAPDGTSASRIGVPKLFQSILKDLGSRSPQDRPTSRERQPGALPLIMSERSSL
jgi:hypothetical protein